MNIEQLIAENGATIVDVRTPMEFMGGHVVDSVNIPISELPYRMEELSAFKSPIIFCCASGNRSEQATQYCNSAGIPSYNGGPWTNVNFYKSLSI
jgi:rhodanese-related sulfurtransferase